MSAVRKFIGVFSEKDLDSRFTFYNAKLLEYAGLIKRDSALGLTDYELPWSHYADLYRSHEKEAISGNHYSAIIPVTIYNGETRLFLHTKLQRLDNNGQVCGVSCNSVEIINPDIYKLAQAITFKNKYKDDYFYLGKVVGSITLSLRQQEVLFFLIRGKSAKAIAKILEISARTVEYYIEVIKIKFNCHNKEELMDLVMNNDIAKNIPRSLNLKKLLQRLEA